MFEMWSVYVPMVMTLGFKLSLEVWGLSGGVSVWFGDDIVFLLGPRNPLVMFCSKVLMLGLFLVHTFTKSELIELDCFVQRNWLKAFCCVCFRSLVFIRSYCADVFAVIRLDEILCALFSINLNELIKLMTKLSSSLDMGIAADVGCLLK